MLAYIFDSELIQPPYNAPRSVSASLCSSSWFYQPQRGVQRGAKRKGNIEIKESETWYVNVFQLVFACWQMVTPPKKDKIMKVIEIQTICILCLFHQVILCKEVEQIT